MSSGSPHPATAPGDSTAESATPAWLLERLQEAGGRVPFRTYMEWALHDPAFGAYGAGRLAIGPRGDFATAPSLGPAFAELLAPQLAEWLRALGDGPLALVETGPGEGHLAGQLARAIHNGWPQLAARCELVLVEPNPGMVRRQQRLLEGAELPLRWCDFEGLAAAPLRGVVLAHEVQDALAVERIVWDGSRWCQQQVARTEQQSLELVVGDPLEGWAHDQLALLGLLPPPDGPQRPAGWTTELHPGLGPWLEQAGSALAEGKLLVVDYALEASRYYALQRAAGTLMAYRQQLASGDPLREPGSWDLTTHLCLEALQRAATASGWAVLGSCRQGQALLVLGLAQALHDLQGEVGQAGAQGLAERLATREALLRLVDPAGLGDFRWIALARGGAAAPIPRFLREPAV
ncbi:MAG: SAM-dependent methyltransferase [Cyanobium sp. ELA507]